MIKPPYPIVIFDSHCLLCNKSLDILIKLDKKRVLRYCALDGEFAKTLAIDREIDSIIFYDNGELYYKSTAVLRIARSLGGVWIGVNIFYVLPRFVRDSLYDIVAKYRYKIWGRLDRCRMILEEERDLFMD